MCKRASTLLSDQDAFSLGLFLRQFQNRKERRRDEGQNDRKGAEAPAPVDVEDEPFSGLGPSKGSDHVWRRSEGKCKTTISEICCISGQHTDRVDDTGKSDSVEDLLIDTVLSHRFMTCKDSDFIGLKLTCAAQNVAKFCDTAIKINPKVENPTISAKPSARPHTFNNFAMGMYTAAVMESDTMLMTDRSECDWKSLVT